MSDLPFHRIIVRFHQGIRPLPPPLQLIVEMARNWRLDLVGTFAPDPNLSRIAKHPATREFRLHELKWSSVEHATITRQLDSVSKECEREFVHFLQSAKVQGRFASEISETAEDLLVVCEPDNPLDQLGRSFRDEIGIVLAQGNAVLVVPRRVAHSRGPIVSISEGEDEQLQAMGTELASKIGERLYNIELSPGEDLQSLPARLDPLKPGLLLTSRRFFDDRTEKLLAVTSACRVPMLTPAHTPDRTSERK